MEATAARVTPSGPVPGSAARRETPGMQGLQPLATAARAAMGVAEALRACRAAEAWVARRRVSPLEALGTRASRAEVRETEVGAEVPKPAAPVLPATPAPLARTDFEEQPPATPGGPSARAREVWNNPWAKRRLGPSTRGGPYPDEPPRRPLGGWEKSAHRADLSPCGRSNAARRDQTECCAGSGAPRVDLHSALQASSAAMQATSTMSSTLQPRERSM
jgi:hypothetical protein